MYRFLFSLLFTLLGVFMDLNRDEVEEGMRNTIYSPQFSHDTSPGWCNVWDKAPCSSAHTSTGLHLLNTRANSFLAR